MEHTAIPQGEIHSPYQWIVADETARAAIVPAATDSDKLCLQRSGRRVYRLISVSPVTWEVDHQHGADDIMGLGTAASLDAASGGDAADDELVLGNDSRLTNPRQPTEHRHAASDLDGLGTASVLDVAASGNAEAGEVVKGDDSRLSDSRQPIAHGHSTSEISGSFDATRLVGMVPIESIPPSALGRMVEVPNQAARYALTTASVQTGDTVRENDTGLMWYVVNEANLSNADGYREYTAGSASEVPWGGVMGKPSALQGGGTSAQYVAGDMTLKTLNAAAVGLGNVNNTSDANKPVSTAQQTALDGKEATISAGTTAQYWRGDKVWTTLNKAAVGLGNVDNTSDANKPISTAQQTALDAKAPLANPTFTGGVSAPNINGAATSGFRNKITNGCMRISKRGGGAAVLGVNLLGADGMATVIGGWSAITGSISTEQQIAPARTSSGSTHYVTINTASGSTGGIYLYGRIEAADSAELANKPVTVSVRVTAGAKQIDRLYMRVYKANSVNNFSAQTLVSHGADYGVIATSTTIDYAHTFTCAGADAVTGLQIDVVVEYLSAVSGTFDVIFADLQCCAGSQRMPFELRPIAIEEQLRRRYYQKQSVRVNTSSNWTCFPIGMVKTPTLSGGGAGFTSTGTTADTLMCYQTTAAAQTLILDAEL